MSNLKKLLKNLQTDSKSALFTEGKIDNKLLNKSHCIKKIKNL